MSADGNLSQGDIDTLLASQGGGGESTGDSDSAPKKEPAESSSASSEQGAESGKDDSEQKRANNLLNKHGKGEAGEAESSTAEQEGESQQTATAAAVSPGKDALQDGEDLKLPEQDSKGPLEDPSAVDQLELLKDVPVKVRVELGKGRMYFKDILCLTHGSVVELDKFAGDPLNIYVNERLIAKGEVLVLSDNFCIRITEIYSAKDVLTITD